MPFSYRVEVKRGRVERLLEVAEGRVPLPADVLRAVEGSLINPGPVATWQWLQLELLLLLVLAFKRRSREERRRLLDDPWAFRDFVDEVEEPTQPAQRLTLLYLAFPDVFARVVSQDALKKISKAFAEELGDEATGEPVRDAATLAARLPSNSPIGVDFYDEPYKSRWSPDPAPSNTPDEVQGDTEQAPAGNVDVRLPNASTDLAEELLVDRCWLQECVELLRDRPQLIFYGPPGTGKTYVAQALARRLADGRRDNVRLVQFHPAYSYEDFVEGYRPQVGEGGRVDLKLVAGPLRRLAKEAEQRPDELFVLVVDEINRGNLAKIFGELYFLLEYRQERVQLMLSRDGAGFRLPPNLLLLGTMNTADRSIALVDAAMRRRFAFVELSPAVEPTRGLLHRWLAEKKRDDEPARLLDALNERIDDPDMRVGLVPHARRRLRRWRARAHLAHAGPAAARGAPLRRRHRRRGALRPEHVAQGPGPRHVAGAGGCGVVGRTGGAGRRGGWLSTCSSSTSWRHPARSTCRTRRWRTWRLPTSSC